MRKVQIIQVGKTKESYLQQGLKIYEEKLKRYCQLSTVNVSETNYRKTGYQEGVKQEGIRISKYLQPRQWNVVLDEQGKQLSSVQLSQHFAQWANQGFSHINFVIGGAYGVEEEVKKKARFLLSFSCFTMTHQMIRLFLLEQIYRAFTLIHKEPYHHP